MTTPYHDWPALRAEGEAGGYTLQPSGVSILAVFIADSTSDHRADKRGYLERVDAWLKAGS